MDQTKIDLTDLNPPRRELSNGGLGFVVALSVCWQIDFLCACTGGPIQLYKFYARCGMSMWRIYTLFGVSLTLVHDSVYAWANLLCICLPKFFPAPTRSQLLWTYPKSVMYKEV